MDENVKKEVERIIRDEISKKNTNEHPLCILIGGLPGSGKTNLVKKVQRLYSTHDFVVIDADNYRNLHPNYNELRRIPERAIAETIEFSNAVEAELIRRAFEKRCDIISVTTLRATEAIKQLLYEPAEKAGYKVEIHLMSVPIEECGLSAQIRYERQILQGECPRFTPMSFIESSLQGIKHTIQLIQGKDEKIVIKIYSRGENEQAEPIEVFDTQKTSDMYGCAMEAFLNPDKRYDKGIAVTQINNLYRIKQNRNASTVEFDSLKRLMNLYNQDIDMER